MLRCDQIYSDRAGHVRVQGEQWKKTTLQTSLVFPGIIFVIFLSLNFLVWGQKSSGAVPFGTLFALCFLWFGISVPLVFVGSYFGYKKPAPEDPVRTNKIPRQIPEQACLHLAAADAADDLCQRPLGKRKGTSVGC